MKLNFNQLKVTRQNTKKLLLKYFAEKQVEIPNGFNNSLFWNFGHMVVVQQLLTFGLSGLEINIEKEIIEIFKKGSNPRENKINISFDKLNELSNELILKTEQFYFEGKFENYTPYTTSYGISLNNIEEAISFNNIHEGLHLGYMMALSKNL
jgi:hypothetical protein